MSTLIDQDLRRALAPLREIDPSDDAVERALMHASRPDPKRQWSGSHKLIPFRRATPGRHWVIGIGAAVAACVGILAGLPFGLFEGSNTGSGSAILRTAAAVAADQPANPFTYRYTKLITRETYSVSKGGHRASATLAQPSEQWVDRQGRGRQLLQTSHIVARSGDSILQATLPRGLQPPGAQPYRLAGPVRPPIPLKDLPTDPGVLLQTLITGYRNGRISADGSRPSANRERYQLTTVILLLLGDANVTPNQRAALFAALGRMDDVTSLGTITDPLGRRGQGITIKTTPADPLPGARFTVIFNLKTSALLSWTVTNELTANSSPALVARSHTVVRAGGVGNSGQRP